MKGEVKTTNRVQELVEGIYRQEDNKNELYRELLKIASVDELGSHYTTSDFNVFFYGDALTVDEKVQIINKGYYKEFSNLVGLSKLPKIDEVDTQQLQKGIIKFIDSKLIPWIEMSIQLKEEEFTGFYELLLSEFNSLKGVYLNNNEQLRDITTRTGILISRLKRQTVNK